MPQHHDLVCMSVNPVMPKMMLPDVTDVVMPRNPTSATLPHTNQPDPASQPYDSMDVSKMVRDSATVDNFQAFPAIWIRVETKSRRTADITPLSIRYKMSVSSQHTQLSKHIPLVCPW
ncbi:hypothetical protein BKA82DRAFT_620302 [Pisolithus tinctorius]|uniref:Uncharacterized protein n=1 Tax=Pisolithus tinctorius Marx 270 TaxID=870435 RepID=A0A0C3NRG0_PISTI|nr:hypothetical protein BKA82DRAFT_620302 [Pisolithus tinctorius]KIO03450.1 hypothetical protein M404DRAFT_620302 [Pisolithus tinctorius Marx 270]